MLLKPVLLTCVPLVVLLSIFPGPTGKPMLNIADDTTDLLTSWKHKGQKLVSYIQSSGEQYLPVDATKEPEPKPLEVYRWQDKNGVWHFSQEKPIGNIEAETIKVSQRVNNLMPAPRDDLVEHNVNEKTLSNSANNQSQNTQVNEVTPFNVLEKAKALQEVAKQRNQTIESL